MHTDTAMSTCQPTIDPTARIATNATVIGNVEIGADSTILFNAVLRGDCEGSIVLGARTNIQDGACVHVPLNGKTILGNEVTIGHGAILHGCTIGDNTLIGMGAIVLDGAIIGKRCLIGAGALVTGTARIPDNTLAMGSPARPIRPLTDEELEYAQVAWQEYVQIGKDLVAQGLMSQGCAYSNPINCQ